MSLAIAPLVEEIKENMENSTDTVALSDQQNENQNINKKKAKGIAMSFDVNVGNSNNQAGEGDLQAAFKRFLLLKRQQNQVLQDKNVKPRMPAEELRKLFFGKGSAISRGAIPSTIPYKSRFCSL